MDKTVKFVNGVPSGFRLLDSKLTRSSRKVQVDYRPSVSGEKHNEPGYEHPLDGDVREYFGRNSKLGLSRCPTCNGVPCQGCRSDWYHPTKS